MSTPTGDDPDKPEAPFDPYRFGKPEFPVPPEYAPPGYVPEPPPDSPAGQQPGPGAYPGAQQGGYQGGYAGGQQGGYQGGYQVGYQGGQYGQAPPPPAHHGYAQPGAGHGKATASMVLGIASILLFWLTVIDAIVVILSVVFGILALAESRSRNGRGRGTAIVGLVCATAGAVAAIVATVFFVHVINQCGGFQNTNDPGFRQCVQNHVG